MRSMHSARERTDSSRAASAEGAVEERLVSKVPKGFAILSPEQREAARLKSLETRWKNAAKRWDEPESAAYPTPPGSGELADF